MWMLNGLGPPLFTWPTVNFFFLFFLFICTNTWREEIGRRTCYVRSRKKKKSNHFLTPGFHIQKISEKKRRKGPMTVCESASKMFLSASKGKKKRFPYRSYYAVIRSLWSAWFIDGDFRFESRYIRSSDGVFFFFIFTRRGKKNNKIYFSFPCCCAAFSCYGIHPSPSTELWRHSWIVFLKCLTWNSKMPWGTCTSKNKIDQRIFRSLFFINFEWIVHPLTLFHHYKLRPFISTHTFIIHPSIYTRIYSFTYTHIPFIGTYTEILLTHTHTKRRGWVRIKFGILINTKDLENPLLLSLSVCIPYPPSFSFFFCLFVCVLYMFAFRSTEKADGGGGETLEKREPWEKK